ncbi:MAG: dipeptide epimerase [Planctomycetota bacterium]
MKVRYHLVRLPLEDEFTIARGSRTHQSSLIVELQRDGVSGFGEATENAYYGVNREAMVALLQSCSGMVERYDGNSADELWRLLQPLLVEEPFLLAAIDAAAHDLFGKLAGQHTFEALGLAWKDVVHSSFTIGIDSTKRMVEKMNQHRWWPAFKIKLGTDHDLEIIGELRRHSSATFRVDANCAWTPQQTIDYSHSLRKLGVELIEQPLPADSAEEDHRRVYQEAVLPIIADESCLMEADVERCHLRFHGINVKLSKCGGMTPAIRMLRQARKLGMTTMIGCMVESSVGISAAAQLLPLLDYADLDGAALLAVDAARGVTVDEGVAILPKTKGNGIELIPSSRMESIEVTQGE